MRVKILALALYVLFTKLLCCSTNCTAQYSSGARASGMANTSVTLTDEWAAFQNVAGIQSDKKICFGNSYKKSFGLLGIQEKTFVAVAKIWKGTSSLTFYNQGNEWFRFNKIALGYAHKINFVRLGVQLHYLQTTIEELGTRQTACLEFGGIAELIPNKIVFGANIFNLNQAKTEGELIPVAMKTGLSYRVETKVVLNAEIEKDLLYKPTIKFGLEYAVMKNLKIRTGIKTKPYLHFFGLGFHDVRIQIDYAMSRHPHLGYSHELSLGYSLNKQK